LLDFVAAMRIERALQRLLELDEMLVAHVVEAMATLSVRAPLLDESVVLDVAIRNLPFPLPREMLLDDHANDTHVDQGNKRL